MEWPTSWPHHQMGTKSTHLKWRDLHPKGLWHKKTKVPTKHDWRREKLFLLWGDDQSCNLRTFIVITQNSAWHWKVSYCRKKKKKTNTEATMFHSDIVISTHQTHSLGLMHPPCMVPAAGHNTVNTITCNSNQLSWQRELNIMKVHLIHVILHIILL